MLTEEKKFALSCIFCKGVLFVRVCYIISRTQPSLSYLIAAWTFHLSYPAMWCDNPVSV